MLVLLFALLLTKLVFALDFLHLGVEFALKLALDLGGHFFQLPLVHLLQVLFVRHKLLGGRGGRLVQVVGGEVDLGQSGLHVRQLRLTLFCFFCCFCFCCCCCCDLHRQSVSTERENLKFLLGITGVAT